MDGVSHRDSYFTQYLYLTHLVPVSHLSSPKIIDTRQVGRYTGIHCTFKITHKCTLINFVRGRDKSSTRMIIGLMIGNFFFPTRGSKFRYLNLGVYLKYM